MQLNVRSRFEIFENRNQASETSADRSDTVMNGGAADSSAVKVTMGSTIRSRMAKLQQKISMTSMENEAIDEDGQIDNNRNGTMEGDGDIDDSDENFMNMLNLSQPKPLNGVCEDIQGLRSRFENGEIMSKKERREEQKQEIQNIRSRLFMGKQARIKEMYQQAVAESDTSMLDRYIKLLTHFYIYL